MKKEQNVCGTCVDFFTNRPATRGSCQNERGRSQVVRIDTPACRFWQSRHEFRERSRQAGPGKRKS